MTRAPVLAAVLVEQPLQQGRLQPEVFPLQVRLLGRRRGLWMHGNTGTALSLWRWYLCRLTFNAAQEGRQAQPRTGKEGGGAVDLKCGQVETDQDAPYVAGAAHAMLLQKVCRQHLSSRDCVERHAASWLVVERSLVRHHVPLPPL